jgi:hypothetical protein
VEVNDGGKHALYYITATITAVKGFIVDTTVNHFTLRRVIVGQAGGYQGVTPWLPAMPPSIRLGRM